ncbi:MAG: hypothetical protein JKY70_19590 [Mucilaginibacter sp.]|nr:hypothetical protein [Mucilaginibacter sp.]
MKKTIATIAIAAISFGSINAFAAPMQTQQDTTKTKKEHKKMKKEKKMWKDTSKMKKDTMKM